MRLFSRRRQRENAALDDPPPPPVPHESRIEGANTFTCATCHALREPAVDGLRRPGHPIGDATRRPSYKDGKVPRMLDAVNSCLTEWMNADAWTENDARYTALHGWLDGQAGSGAAPPVTIQRVDPPASLVGGDPERGLATFNGACAVCHGANAEGTQKAHVRTVTERRYLHLRQVRVPRS